MVKNPKAVYGDLVSHNYGTMTTFMYSKGFRLTVKKVGRWVNKADKTLYNKSVKECKNVCEYEKTFVCMSFNYKRSDRKCELWSSEWNYTNL